MPIALLITFSPPRQAASTEQHHGREQPQQRVALHQAAAADQLEHDQEQHAGAEDRDELDAAGHQMLRLRGHGRRVAALDHRPPAGQADQQREQHLDHVVGGLARC